MPLRDYQPANDKAAAAIPQWAGNATGRKSGGRMARVARQANSLGLIPSLSEEHAATQWEDARQYVIRNARKIYGQGSGAEARLGLLLVARLATHVVTCDRCASHGIADTQTPADWLAWACRRWAPACAVYEPAWRTTHATPARSEGWRHVMTLVPPGLGQD